MSPASWPAPVAPEPHPLSDALSAHLRDVLTQIPSGKRGQATVTLTTSGFEAGVGAKGQIRRVEITGAGWAAKEWGGRGWSAGARGAFSW